MTAIPGGDAAIQNNLDGASIEVGEHSGVHTKPVSLFACI